MLFTFFTNSFNILIIIIKISDHSSIWAIPESTYIDCFYFLPTDDFLFCVCLIVFAYVLDIICRSQDLSI